MVSTGDLCLVLGIIFVILSLPSLLNAWVEGRAPRFGALLSIGGIVLVGYAVTRQSYAPDEVPAVFLRVLSRLLG